MQVLANAFPAVPISQEQLQTLVAAMLVYRRYRAEKTPPTTERLHTLCVLESLIPRLSCGVGIYEGAAPLWLTVNDVGVIKAGLMMLLDQLKRKPLSKKLSKGMQELKELQTVIEQFRTTQD